MNHISGVDAVRALEVVASFSTAAQTSRVLLATVAAVPTIVSRVHGMLVLRGWVVASFVFLLSVFHLRDDTLYGSEDIRWQIWIWEKRT